MFLRETYYSIHCAHTKIFSEESNVMLLQNLEEPSFNFNMKVDLIGPNNVRPNMRFGTNLNRQKQFVKDMLNLEVDGFRICSKYDISWRNGAVHAETFLWNLQAYRVSF